MNMKTTECYIKYKDFTKQKGDCYLQLSFKKYRNCRFFIIYDNIVTISVLLQYCNVGGGSMFFSRVGIKRNQSVSLNTVRKFKPVHFTGLCSEH